MDHIRRDGLGTMVLAVISLGKGQYDLAVVKSDIHLDLVASYYHDMTHFRLKSSDPLLAPEVGLSVSYSISKALNLIRDQYILAKKEQPSLDKALLVWFDEEIGRLEQLLSSNSYIDNTPWK